MYLRLKEPFALLGWERLPYALRNLKTGATQFLDETAFQGLSFCNGAIDINSPVVLKPFRDVALRSKDEGIVEACDYGEELSAWQKYIKAPCRYIECAHWSITGRCNLKCRHCYLSAPQAKYGELSFDQCLSIIRQLSEANIGQVSLTGGEPLFRSDLFAIIDALLARRIAIKQICSNGALVTKEFLAKLDRRSIKPEFCLSFDGVGCHDWLRGVAGAEEGTVAAIRLLVAGGFHVNIETSLHRGNIHTLKETFELLAKIGVGFWKTSPTSDSGNWLKERGRHNLGAETLFEAYLRFIPEYRAAGAPLSIMLGGFFMCGKGSEDYSIPSKRFDGTGEMLRQTLCRSARTIMYIAADGKLLPCIPMAGMPIQDEMPNLATMPLREALTDSKYLGLIDTRLDELLAKNEKCAACEHRLVCGGGCRAGAMIGGGDYLGCDDYTCHLFKKHYEDRIRALYQ